MTPGPDESAYILTECLWEREPFTFTRIGDGVLCLAFGVTRYGRGEIPDANGLYLDHAALGRHMCQSIQTIATSSQRAFFGEVPEGMVDEWAVVLSWIENCELLSNNAVEHDRLSKDVHQFYKALAEDDRRKVYVATPPLAAGADFMRADFITFPEGQEAQDDLDLHDQISEQIIREGYEIVILSAAHAEKFIAAQVVPSCPFVTVIDIGSALDPMFVGPTRSGQMPMTVLHWFYKDLL